MHVLPGLIFTLTALSTIVLAVPAPAAAACPDTAIAATGPYGPLKPSTLAALSTASRLDLNTALSPPCAALPTTAAGLNITCATTMDSPIVSELQGAWEHLKAPSKAAMDCTNFRPKNCSMVAEFTVPSFDGVSVALCGDAFRARCGEVADLVKMVMVKCEWNYRAQGVARWEGGRRSVAVY